MDSWLAFELLAGQTGVRPAEGSQRCAVAGGGGGCPLPSVKWRRGKEDPIAVSGWLLGGSAGGGSRVVLCICPRKRMDNRNKLPEEGGNFN